MAKIFYARVDEFWHKEEKYAYLEEKQHVGNVEWQDITPDAKHNWLTEGMQDEFESFVSIGSRETKASEKRDVDSIFKNYGRGVATTRDAWAFNFNSTILRQAIERTIETFNEQVSKWKATDKDISKVDDFVISDPAKISWSEGLKSYLVRAMTLKFDPAKVRRSLYRPFMTTHLYFDERLNE